MRWCDISRISRSLNSYNDIYQITTLSTSKGRLLVAGNNSYGRLGVGSTPQELTFSSTFLAIPVDGRITSVSCSTRWMCAIVEVQRGENADATHSILVWGSVDAFKLTSNKPVVFLSQNDLNEAGVTAKPISISASKV